MSRTLNANDGADGAPPIPGLIGQGEAMQRVYRLTRQVAKSNASVLLLGETGTGKTLVAHALHAVGPRALRKFATISCAAWSEDQLAARLFGPDEFLATLDCKSVHCR